MEFLMGDVGMVSFAESTIKVFINNQESECDAPDQIINGRTLVPMSVLF